MAHNTETDASDGKTNRRKLDPGAPIPMPAWLFYPISIGTLAAAVLLYRRGDPVAALTVVTVSLCGWSGFKMGLCRISATVMALIAAVAFAPSLGMRFEGRFSEQFGTTGLTNRFLCVAAIGVVISLVVTILVTMIASHFLSQRRKLRWFNRFIGFAVGLVEGVLIAMLVLGALLSVQKWQRGVDIENNNTAKAVDQWASNTRQSAVGPFVRDYNPFERIEMLSQVGRVQDTVRRLSDPGNIQRLLNDPEITELRTDPALAAAIDEISRDPSIRDLIEQGQPLDRQTLMKLMNSPSVMRLADQPEFIERAQAIVKDME